MRPMLLHRTKAGLTAPYVWVSSRGVPLQRVVSRRSSAFSDDVVAAAMIDRLVHHAEVLTLTGDSYRTRQRLAKEDRAADD